MKVKFNYSEINDVCNIKIKTGHVLNEFVRDCAIKYVEDENPEIRKAAALTCCQLFVRDPICYQTSNHSIQVVGEVMEKLLTVGIADSGEPIVVMALKLI